ncbi:efflux RND transporter periplasmic adaptor subunit [Tuwongella immobilis]|uniref:CusB-like beta-barrel domain-containing protein n=1 Tax=Tuwongella immobilis TaxID=692036 RepID=A0A6C2YY45_9BACT|nr:efflux RND transporter periplasmic adaptor subunit [Tuwongella immobilis]VIP05759.1 rnd family efflux transporter mfp subunit : Efflux transporter, RND family, MFP subunit OS=Planctomyces limnophilus (strain ATCC 43296 / DSM 3776 / IFAM 1008 / 290) GN=Plim_0558 PE=4 SV=1: HlyD_2 [Tuwongella immobilis]VTS08874.1 rnd family efflux transporter mfp subunit : Efflux transporter, RND family, MFP subunit OS=Planctomyces limnophilus (strain ATCC 43296 / DSM 3776 / IFAM 1008 / 290) GN=Plim_0558 PE=4 SV
MTPPETVPKRRIPWGWLLLVVAVSGLAAGRVYFPGEPRAELTTVPEVDTKRVAVTVVPVTTREIVRKASTVGTLYGFEEIPISAKVDGRVMRVLHDNGDRVKPGELLVEMEPTDAQLAVEESQRAYELELARLGLKELPPPGKQINLNELPSVAKAIAEEANALGKLERVQLLRKAISQEEKQERETEVEVARTALLQAKLEAEVHLAAARQRKATLMAAQQRLKDLQIVAPTVTTSDNHPVDFAVAARKVSPGEYLRSMPGESSTLFQLILDRKLKLMASLPERYSRDIKPGLQVELRVDSLPGETVFGQVARVSPLIDRSARTFQIEVHVPNDDRRLFPGSFAKAEVTLKTAAVMTVPAESVIRFAGVSKVFVIRNDVAHEVPVVVGDSLTESRATNAPVWVEVSGKLKPGDSVVRTGQAALAEGVPVRLRVMDGPSTVAQKSERLPGTAAVMPTTTGGR